MPNFMALQVHSVPAYPWKTQAGQHPYHEAPVDRQHIQKQKWLTSWTTQPTASESREVDALLT